MSGNDHDSGQELSEANLIQRVFNWLGDVRSPVAVHAGHFLLIPKGNTCIPAVLEECQYLGIDGGTYGAVRDLIAGFPLATWRLGVELLARLKQEGHAAGLITLVNDWQFLRNLPKGKASQLRRQFYEDFPGTLRSYAEVLTGCRMGQKDFIPMGEHPAFVSENWLRRRVEARLKRLAKVSKSPGPSMTWKQREDGKKTLVVLDDLQRECQLLVCGQSDCAGEVMELIYRLKEQGYTRLINFIPRECEVPVNEGTRRAITLFQIEEFQALNIALPCIGGGFRQGVGVPKPSMQAVSSRHGDNRSIDATVERVSS